MSIVAINPGSGPVPHASEEHATTNIAAFVDDLRAEGIRVAEHTRLPDADYGEGRYAYVVTTESGQDIEIQMPGLPLDRVRYMQENGQNIRDFPRLYVDGSSWVWCFAVSVCHPALAEARPRRRADEDYDDVTSADVMGADEARMDACDDEREV